MTDQFERLRLLIGDEGLNKLKRSRVAVFGLGGVGGHLAEALVRSGIGAIDLIDDDTVSLTNLNRQAVAYHSTLGMAKTEAAKIKLADINPNCKITVHNTFFTPETSGNFDFTSYDYIADAIDTVSGKIELARVAQEYHVKAISSMGAGNKLDPTKFEVADIYKTDTCPLAKVMRRELKKRGIKHLKVVYSREPALKPLETNENGTTHQKRQTPGSAAFVPPVVGLIMAGEIIKDIVRESNYEQTF